MAKQLSGKRYAQAIFDLALDKDQVEQWGEDLAEAGRQVLVTAARHVLGGAAVSGEL